MSGPIKYKKFSDILKRIPEEWRDAEVRFSYNTDEQLRSVARIDLRENADGRKIIVLAQMPTV